VLSHNINKPWGHYEVGHTGWWGSECYKCSIEANRTGKPFLKVFGFKVFKRILRLLGYCVLRYEGTRLPECKKNACNNPPSSLPR